jgi:hypothetical protein
MSHHHHHHHHSSPGSQAATLSPTSAENLLASKVMSKLGTSAGSATLHGSNWHGSGTESVMSGIGSATLVGSKGVSSVTGSSNGPTHSPGNSTAFSFDTVAVGGQQVISNFVSGVHSVTSPAAGAHHHDGHQKTHHHGGHQVALHHGKTVVHIKHHHH